MDVSRSKSSWNLANLNSRFQTVLLAAMAAAACYLAAKLGGALNITAPQALWRLWPGCAVLVAILLLLPKKIWPILIPAGLAGSIVYTGAPGSTSATTTMDGKQIPPPPPKFGGVIKESAKDSTPWWPPRVVPPKSAPNWQGEAASRKARMKVEGEVSKAIGRSA